MHWSLWIYNALLLLDIIQVVYGQRKKFVRSGDDVIFPCSRRNARLIRVSDNSGYIFLLIRNGTPQKIQGEWIVEKYDSISDNLDLTLRLPNFNTSQETTIRCEDERENGLITDLRAIISPRVTMTSESGSELTPGTPLRAKCSALGGSPPPTIKWTDSMGNRYDASTSQVIQRSDNGNIVSSLKLDMSRDFDGEIVSCEVYHANNLTVKQLTRLAIDYPPTSADITFTAQYIGDALGALCTANGRPTPDLVYYLSDNQSERNVNEMYILTQDDNNKFIKCRAANRYGSRNSTGIRLMIQTPTPMPTTEQIVVFSDGAQITTQSVNLDPNLITSTQKSDSGAIINSSLSSSGGSETNSRISAANNITISCVAVGVLCTAVIIGIMVRRKLRFKAETYRTDVTVYEEGTAFQDPELEAKFKKEYFM